ncbi:hypothetical protein K435DRAFT_839404 [Dendrothele bispora CBS 962.96]|uniref:Uncharacterized protein n=1 Tax=Dendrothele bispora (strain CBS 962.96) TaxID=1314807 RepID=A0A4S8M1X2_DENBC|nr:hypothetical protein K435DRAFT_839404 [Dendrothele bispora CBS 962.96]
MSNDTRDDPGNPNILFKSINDLEIEPYIMEKFPEKYSSLKKQYGAMELIWDDSNTDVIDLVAPHEYLEEADNTERARLEGQLDDADNTPKRPVTSTLLKSLAEAERNFYKTEAELFRTEPGYLSHRVVVDGGARHELMPDLNGDAVTLEDLLSKPRFVCQIARFAIHNTILRAGLWSVVVEFLEEVELLDATQGRMGALEKRDSLIHAVKKIVQAGMANVEDQVMRSVIGSELGKKFWRRAKNKPDFTGAEIQLLDHDTQVMNELISTLATKDDLKCSLIRFASQKHEILPGWRDSDYHNDLINSFRAASPETINQLPEHLVDLVTYLNRLDDYYDLLGGPESSRPVPFFDDVQNDNRFRRYSNNISLVQKSVEDAFLEKNVKKGSSLETASVLDKFWKEIDESARKIGRTKKLSINKIEDFVLSHVEPRWIVSKKRTRLVPSPESTSAEPEANVSQGEGSPVEPAISAVTIKPIQGEGSPVGSADSATSIKHTQGEGSPVDSADSAAIIEPIKPSEPSRSQPPEKPPADIKPYNPSRPSDSSSAVASTDEPKRVGPKVKTRPPPSSTGSSPQVPQTDDGRQADKSTLAHDLKLPFFRVPKHVYDTFEVILDPKVKGNLSWKDILFALTSIGMRYEHHTGSHCLFTPMGDIANNTPLMCPQPHGRDPTRLGHRRILLLARNMFNSYGWTKEWFGLKNKE